MSAISQVKFQDFFKYFEPKRSQHVAGVKQFFDDLKKDAPHLLDESSKWIKEWREPHKTPAPTPTKPVMDRKLPVKAFPQWDSTVAGQAGRMCFSSTASEAGYYLNPSVFPTNKGQVDDWYLKNMVGPENTTDAASQVRALRKLGFEVRFSDGGDWDLMRQQIDAGIPFPIGILHHGELGVEKLYGGHWIDIIGYTADGKYVIVNDPAGELDMVKGYYLGGSGAGLKYSIKNLEKRWRPDGFGYCLIFDKKK